MEGLNLYTYCNNDPINWIDPWGLCKDDSLMKDVGKELLDSVDPMKSFKDGLKEGLKDLEEGDKAFKDKIDAIEDGTFTPTSVRDWYDGRNTGLDDALEKTGKGLAKDIGSYIKGKALAAVSATAAKAKGVLDKGKAVYRGWRKNKDKKKEKQGISDPNASNK